MSRRRKRTKTLGDVIRLIVMLAALAVFLYSGYTLYGFYKEYKKSSVSMTIWRTAMLQIRNRRVKISTIWKMTMLCRAYPARRCVRCSKTEGKRRFRC